MRAMGQRAGIIVVVCILCGSIFILPHMLLRALITSLEQSTAITVHAYKTERCGIGYARLRAVKVGINDVAGTVTFKRMDVTYNPLSLAGTLQITIMAERLSLPSGISLLPVSTPLEINALYIPLEIEPGRFVRIVRATVDSSLGRGIIDGELARPSTIDLRATFSLEPGLWSDLAPPTAGTAAPGNRDARVTICGDIHEPDIEISSNVFRFSLKKK